MPQFVAKPLHVQAWQILTVHRNHIRLDVPAGYDPDVFLTARQVNSRYPVAGDYYVMLDDGFAYVSPRHVFERKYESAADRKAAISHVELSLRDLLDPATVRR